MRKLIQFKERETQRLFALILAGKMVGVGTVFAAMKAFGWFFSSPASAADKETVANQLANHVNAINTMWVLVAALVALGLAGTATAGVIDRELLVGAFRTASGSRRRKETVSE